jgi:hypothetical protein
MQMPFRGDSRETAHSNKLEFGREVSALPGRGAVSAIRCHAPFTMRAKRGWSLKGSFYY